MSDTDAGFRIPLELPKEEYDPNYMRRLINQLRLNFATIQTSRETSDPVEAMDWFLA